MKLAFVIAKRMSGQGGMEQIVNRVIKNWDEQDDVTLIVSSRTGKNPKWLEGIKYIKLWFQAKLLGYPFLLLHLFWTLHKLKPQAAIAADSKAVRYCCWYRDFFCKELLVVCWIHNTFTNRVAERVKRISSADLYLCISKGMAKSFAGYGIDDGIIYVVNNPLEQGVTQVIARPANAHFVYMGRIMLGVAKSTDDFVKALALLKGEWRADIIGDGDRGEGEQLKSIAKELGIYDKIKFMGWQDYPWSKVQEASCLVMTSDYETFGLVLTEAMQRGLFCISAASEPGPVEIVEEGVNGWFYQPHDVQALAQLMQKVVDKPMDLPESKEIQSSVEKYSADSVVNKMRKFILAKLKHLNNYS